MKRLLLATLAIVALGAAGQAQATCVSSTPIIAPDPGVASSDGDQHIAVQSTYADFQSDPPRAYLTQADLGAAYGVMTGIAPIGDWTFAGMEDLLASQGSDFDYNDLIFGFLGIDNPPAVPEPMTLSLLGVGLVGLAAIRRRKAA